MNQQLFDFIAHCPTAFHTVAHAETLLQKAGYTALSEGDAWTLCPGQGYYVSRNRSSLIAFRIPQGDFRGFMLAAAHGDSPAWRIKENAMLHDQAYTRLSVEKYGGMLCATWMDRPLSIAGRVVLRTEQGLQTKLVDLQQPCALIPNVAIHMNPKANDGFAYNPAVDMLPLYGTNGKEISLRKRVAAELHVQEEDILSTDLMLYNPQSGLQWDRFISAPRLDDLQCVFSILTAFMQAQQAEAMPICCIFDNEEVGSETKQGAASTFLPDTLHRICAALGLDDVAYCRKLACSLLLSCDNAHAVHPNHPELADKNHQAYLNKGIVIKYNASQRYTSDGISAGLFALLCERAGVPTQRFANRADLRGGSTLGNIANTQVSLNTVDIGLAQLAMHSALETAGAEDTESMVRAVRAHFSTAIQMEADGMYTLLP